MTVLKKVWFWISVTGLFLVVALGRLWRRATRQRDEARNERDVAKRSAVRERVLEEDHRKVDDVAKATAAVIQVPVLIVVEKETKAQERAAADPVEELNRRIDEELIQ